jgi:acyl-coenzyme A thioesterase 9
VVTFVNVDAGFEPQPVPPIYPTTYAEDGRYLAAHRRREAYRASQSKGEREG